MHKQVINNLNPEKKMICPRPQKCLLRHIYLPRNKLKRRSKYSITVRFRFISYARYPLLSVCLCVPVCLFVLAVWIYIYIFIYLCCGSRTFTQGQKYKTRYVKKTRLSAEKKTISICCCCNNDKISRLSI